jgi:aspartate/methionine/tyrosine aminotransferase
VLLATGTSLANFLVFSALVREGDVVVCEWPAYEPLWRAAEAQGARLKWLTREADRGFQPNIAGVAREFARGARLLVLSDLHNPSATLLDREFVREVGRLAVKYDAWVLIDEVYLGGVFDRAVESAAGMGDRIVVTSSLTKSYGLGGLRAGWAIAPAELVDRCHDIAALVIGNSPFIAEDAACMAFGNLPQLRQRSERRRAENWPLVRAFAKDRRMLEAEPAGGFICWLQLPDGVDGDRLVDHLVARYDTLVVPGSFFGEADHIRVGFGMPKEIVEEGLKRLGQAMYDVAG